MHTASDFTNHYWLSEIVINFYLLLFLFFLLNALLSLFLTAYHYSHRYQSQCHRRLPNLNVPYFEWHWMSSLDVYVSLKPEAIKILKLWVCLIVIFLLGLLHLDFNQVLWYEESLSSIPPTFPFTACKPWPSARGMVLVAFTAEYQECLKVGLFGVHY